MGVPADLKHAREAFGARAWDTAYRAFARAEQSSPLDAPDLWRYALSATLSGREASFADIIERAHEAFAAAGDELAAARCAFWLGFRLATRGDVGPASGWLARATRLVERAGGDCVERGYLLLPTAYRRLLAGETDAACRDAAGAAQIGERFADADLLALALHLQGRALLGQARVEEGLALLDEAMVGIASGRVAPHVTGLVYCSVIGACRSVYELGRAHEWTEALRRWVAEQPELVAFSGECLAYRAEILNLEGRFHEAMREATRVCGSADYASQTAAVGAAHYQRGEALRMLGEFAAAEEAYRQASHAGREPQPGLSRLRLMQGQPTVAAAALERALAETADPLRRARLLPALCEALGVLGANERSARACDELAEIARRFGSDALRTLAAATRGAVLHAAGDHAAALAPLRAALAGWQALGARYENARTRELLAHACHALGDADGAALELDAARRTFEEIGASWHLARLDVAPGGLTPREVEVLGVIATGVTNRDAALRLGISERTVARHLSNIFGKLGITSRAAATAYAYQNRLLQPPA